MSNEIKVLVYPVGQAPVVKMIDGQLDDMQSIVGGSIQAVDLGAIALIPELEGYDLYCNEEGKLLGLPVNRFSPYDYIAGQYFISKTGDEGETVTLTDDDIKYVMLYLNYTTLSDLDVQKPN